MPEQLRTAWDNLDARQRLTLAIAAAVTLAGLILVAVWSARPEYRVLYSGLSSEDAGAVVEELRSEKVPYRLARGGTSVEVPEGTLYETRLSMAGKGLPSGAGGGGFELFDKNSLPGTDFDNWVLWQRALQGELARTISALDEVGSARVHLNLPRESLYDDPVPPSASVLLDLRPTGGLGDRQVRGIAYMVSSAVEKLKPENVTICDTFGNVLYGSGGGADGPDTAFATAKAYSEALTRRLQSMLDAMFGTHYTIVRAQVDVNMDAEETNEEQVEPVGEGPNSLISREHTSEEIYNSNGAGEGGTTGVPSNVMGAERAAGQDGNGAYQAKEETREYEVSKRVVRRTNKPGKIMRISVAAVVDESLAAQGIDRVRDVLQAAAGVDLSRGDSIVVRPLKLRSAELAAEEEKDAKLAQVAQQRQDTVNNLLRKGVPIVVIVILLAVLLRTAGAMRRTQPASEQEQQVWAEGDMDMGEMEMGGEATEEYGEDYDGGPFMVPPDEREEEILVEELRRIAREQPEVLAEELRNLVNGADDR